MSSALKFAENYLLQNKDQRPSSINKVLTRIRNIKKQAVKNGTETISNSCWIYEQALTAKKEYIKVFNLLKKGAFYDAWCQLERLEILLSTLKDNNNILCAEASGLNTIEKMVSNWQSIYPYKLFASPGFISKYKTCTICGEKVSIRNGCGHKKRKLYNGQICYHSVHELKFLEVSIVSNPAQKYSVLAPENHDYSQVKYVIDRLESAPGTWDKFETKKLYPRSNFNIKDDSSCPCQSEKKFGDCCADKGNILVPHIQINFHQDVKKELLFDIAPY